MDIIEYRHQIEDEWFLFFLDFYKAFDSVEHLSFLFLNILVLELNLEIYLVDCIRILAVVSYYLVAPPPALRLM